MDISTKYCRTLRVYEIQGIYLKRKKRNLKELVERNKQ